MNLLKWNPTTHEWEQFEEGDKIASNLIDLSFIQDLKITSPENGLVLTAPDTTQWRITVNEEGALITTKLDI